MASLWLFFFLFVVVCVQCCEFVRCYCISFRWEYWNVFFPNVYLRGNDEANRDMTRYIVSIELLVHSRRCFGVWMIHHLLGCWVKSLDSYVFVAWMAKRKSFETPGKMSAFPWTTIETPRTVCPPSLWLLLWISTSRTVSFNCQATKSHQQISTKGNETDPKAIIKQPQNLTKCLIILWTK